MNYKIYTHIRSGFAALPFWALPLDQSGSRTQASKPLRHERTLIRVAVLLRLLPDLCLTRKTHERRALFIVPTVNNRQIRKPTIDLMAIDLLRVYVREFTQPGQSEITALVVRSQLHLPGESWLPAAHCTLMHSRAPHVQYHKPHAIVETCYWSITREQLKDRCWGVIRVLNPSDTNPFYPVLFNLRTSIREVLSKETLNQGQLLENHMVNGGITVHSVYRSFLNQIFLLSNLYPFPPAMHSQPRNPPRLPPRGPRQRFSAVISNQHSRPPNRPMRDIFGDQYTAAPSSAATFQLYLSSKGKHKRSLTERVSAIVNALQNKLSDDDSQDCSSALPNDNAHQPSDISQR